MEQSGMPSRKSVNRRVSCWGNRILAGEPRSAGCKSRHVHPIHQGIHHFAVLLVSWSLPEAAPVALRASCVADEQLPAAQVRQQQW